MYKYFFKRLIDIVLASIALVIISPVLVPICIGLLLTGEHYIFYFQKRVGYRNKYFSIWKFATMLKASPGLGTGSITVKNDWRLTPMGKYLRGSKLNEIPQLINILIGDMTIVGPRPLMEVDFLKFSEEVQREFYNCKPGLTGIASIIFRDEERYHSETKIDPHEFDRLYIAPYKGTLELWYQKHISLYTDFMIIFLTAWAIISPENNLVYRVFKDLPEKPAEL